MNAPAPTVVCESLRIEDGAPLGPFGRALRTGEGEALRFLPRAPRDDAEWRAYLDVTAARAPRLSVDQVAGLAERQRVLAAGPRAIENARHFRAGDRPTLAVVTGQQPGLFGGPLLTFHKVAGALHLARKLNGLGGHRVVPVFWVASEDHDFEEVNRAVVVDRQGQPRTLKLSGAADGRSIAHLDVPPPASDAVLAQLAEVLPDTPRGREALALAQREAGDDFASWSVRTLLRVFGDSGLVIADAPWLAGLAGSFYGSLLDDAETIRAAVQQSGEDLRAAGLPAPLFPQEEGATPLFYRERPEGPRLRVTLAADDTVRLRGERSDLTRAGLRERLLQEPACGSGNVVGRVFLQNHRLPLLAYIAGPTEIAYQAQVRAAHAATGRPFPLALPRPEASWVDDKALRGLAAFGLALPDVLTAEAPPVPAAEADAELDQALQAYEQHLATFPDALEALRTRAGSGPDALARAQARIRSEWEKAARKVRSAFEADAGVGRARWKRTLNWLRPQGRPQERILSPLSLVARHGLEAVRAGLLSLDPLPPVHHVLRVGGENPAP